MLMNYAELEYLSALKKDEQKRVIDACHIYGEVMRSNFQNLEIQQTERQRKRFAIGYYGNLSRGKELVREYRKKPKTMWWEKAEQNASMISGGLNLKSGLLTRLITQKKPLKHPPPCSFGFPWYELVDDAGPHKVIKATVGNLTGAGSFFRQAGCQKESHALIEKIGLKHIFINNTAFSIVDANSAGLKLLEAARIINLSADVELATQDESRSVHHPLWADVIQAYKDKPEFRIRHGMWPAWRLHLQTSEPTLFNNLSADKALSNGPFVRHIKCDPFDLARANLDLTPIEMSLESRGSIPDEEESLLMKRLDAVFNGRNPAREQAKHQSVNSQNIKLTASSKSSYFTFTQWAISQGDEWADFINLDKYLAHEYKPTSPIEPSMPNAPSSPVTCAISMLKTRDHINMLASQLIGV